MARAGLRGTPPGAESTAKPGRGIGHRDREKTRGKILAALGRLLARKGSRGLGINAISREAKVDKVLITAILAASISFIGLSRWKEIHFRASKRWPKAGFLNFQIC